MQNVPEVYRREFVSYVVSVDLFVGLVIVQH